MAAGSPAPLSPSRDARRTTVHQPEKVERGLDGWVCDLAGRWRGRSRYGRRLWERAGTIEREASAWTGVAEKELRAELRAMRERVRRRGRHWPRELEAALPLVVEVARRTTGLRAYRTQVAGALALGEGRLAEMATGEGKTLTIALAAAVAGWSGWPCHVITANDYLAGRDAAGLARFYAYAGLTVASVVGATEAADRREGHQAAVVYTTGKELVADYLRDLLVLGPLADAGRRAVARLRGHPGLDRGTVLRGLSTAIIDEVDNQLVDEAVTPLIISRQQENETLSEACRGAEECAAGLLPGDDYEVDERNREVRLLRPGRAKVAAWCEGKHGFLGARAWMEDLVTRSLEARHFFLRGQQYVMVDGKVVIVDEFTGRLMPGRTWRLGVHQAVEAKEMAEVTSPSETLARLSFQRFYRFFDHLAGISGTAREAAREFWRIYRLPFVEIPRHRPDQRRDLPNGFFPVESAKWDAILAEIEAFHAEGRPILIGTRSVSASEGLADRLRERGLVFELLNAVRSEHEAAIISRAGERASITIATNMAGRGTDIVPGEGVARRGGLHVIVSEGHSSARVDRQLRGRAGRQGDPGSSRLFASWDDELYQRQLHPFWQKLLLPWVRYRLPGGRAALALGFHFAQGRAERKARRQRFQVLRQDDEVAKAVIGKRPGAQG